MAVVQTGSLLSFSITSLVQLTRVGSLTGILDNSKSFWVLQLGWAYLGTLESLFGPEVDFCGRLIGRLPFGKIGQMMVSNGVIGAICS